VEPCDKHGMSYFRNAGNSVLALCVVCRWNENRIPGRTLGGAESGPLFPNGLLGKDEVSLHPRDALTSRSTNLWHDSYRKKDKRVPTPAST